MKTGCPAFRFLVLMVVFILVWSLTGCGGNDSDETAPLLILSAIDPTTTGRTRQLSGSVEIGAAVEVTVDTTAEVRDLVVLDGQWSCTVASLAAGDNPVSILATDSTGNQTVLNLNLLYDALSIERWVTPVSGDTVTIGGLVDPDADGTFAVTVDTGATHAPVTIIGDDHWEVVLSGLLPGNNVVKVTITHPNAGVGQVEKSLTISRNSNAPVVSIDPVQSPVTLASQSIAGGRTDTLSVTLLVPTASVGNFNLETASRWSADLTSLQRGKNPFTVSATQNGVTVTARDLIVYNPLLIPNP